MKEFIPFPKIKRLSRECIITEKIDGTNASVYVPHEEEKELFPRKVIAASRTRWIEPEHDNYGFAKWVEENYEELLKLGPGHHFGEWWGKGIQRGYNQVTKCFSLFNVSKWADPEVRPKCCDIVPVLATIDTFDSTAIDACLNTLKEKGSLAAPGYPYPEGVVVYHVQSNSLFKKTIDGDDKSKFEQ